MEKVPLLPIDLQLIFVFDYRCGWAQLTVSGSNPGQVVMGSVRMEAEQAKQVSIVPPWPLHQPLPPGPCPV